MDEDEYYTNPNDPTRVSACYQHVIVVMWVNCNVSCWSCASMDGVECCRNMTPRTGEGVRGAHSSTQQCMLFCNCCVLLCLQGIMCATHSAAQDRKHCMLRDDSRFLQTGTGREVVCLARLTI
jgi:hypothetical protein